MNEYQWFPVILVYRLSSICMMNEYCTILKLKKQNAKLDNNINSTTNLIFPKIMLCLCILRQLSLVPALVLSLALVASLEDLLSLVNSSNCMLNTEPPVRIKCLNVAFKKEPSCRMITSIYQNHSLIKSLEPKMGAKFYVEVISHMPQRLLLFNPTILIEFSSIYKNPLSKMSLEPQIGARLKRQNRIMTLPLIMTSRAPLSILFTQSHTITPKIALTLALSHTTTPALTRTLTLSHTTTQVGTLTLALTLKAMTNIGAAIYDIKVFNAHPNKSGTLTVKIPYHHGISHSKSNKLTRIRNGNIKLLHLNKGGSDILTKIVLIKDLIDKEVPDLVSLNESNCSFSVPDETKPFDGYNFEHKHLKLRDKSSCKARTSIAIKYGIEYERLKNLEPDINSLIWLKLKLKKQELLVCSGYRQWALPRELGQGNSRENKMQKLRFESYLNSIQEALKLNLKLIILHDVNIDISEKNSHNFQYNINNLHEIYLQFLTDNNLTIVNNKFTRYFPNQSPSTLDHVVTNDPAYLESVRTIDKIAILFMVRATSHKQLFSRRLYMS